MTVTSDNLDDILDTDNDEPAGPSGAPPSELFLCTEIDATTKEVCGAEFETRAKLNGHKTGKHKRAANAAANKAPDREKAKKAEKKAGDQALRTDPNIRTQTYTSSIAILGLAAHIGIPKFDEYDLDAVNKGAPGLAGALAAVGEQHASVQQACDLILGGGMGGAYVQLVLASLAMFAPIAAHHGWIPASAGERFGAVIGVAVPPPPTSAPQPAPSGDGDGGTPVHIMDPANVTADDVLMFMSGVPETVMFDAMSKMMTMGGPIGVTVPAFDIPDDRAEPVGVGPQTVTVPSGQSDPDGGAES